MQPMAVKPRYRCVATLRGHTNIARRRRPVKQSVRAIRGAGQVRRRAVERPRRVRIGRQHAHDVARVEHHDDAAPTDDFDELSRDATRAHEHSAAPASSRTARRLLVDAVRGAGQVRRRAVERPRRLRVGRRHAQGLGRVERTVPAYAVRAHGLGAAPASSQTVRRLLADTATGAGLLRRRPPGRPRRVRVARRQTQGVGRVDRRLPRDAARAHGLSAAPASSRHNASITRRRCDGRRSRASPRCRTAASCPGRPTTRS
jgi:hypothetical protein